MNFVLIFKIRIRSVGSNRFRQSFTDKIYDEKNNYADSRDLNFIYKV